MTPTSPVQVLYFIAVTLAPHGANHVNVTGGSEVYGWSRSDSADSASTWVFDKVIDPNQVLANNYIVPDNVKRAQSQIADASQHDWKKGNILVLDNTHQLEKNRDGYVYVVRPGAPNQKSYSFTFSK
jgi:hypothetical protein